MATYALAPAARSDLIELHDYIAKDKPVAAARFAERLKPTCQWLAENPEAGERQDQLAPALRRFTVERYVIYYLPADKGVEIVRIVSGYRDFESLFRRS
jgi:toxin ParE1/3/4